MLQLLIERVIPDAAIAAMVRDPIAEPPPNRGLIRGLFGLIQIMYLCFYIAALFRLTEIERITSSFLPGWGAFAIFVAVLVTAGIGIPLRFYLLSAVAFDHQRFGEKFRRLFLAVLRCRWCPQSKSSMRRWISMA